jgi:hypothetical protein
MAWMRERIGRLLSWASAGERSKHRECACVVGEGGYKDS